MRDNKHIVIYFSSSVEIDAEVKALFEQRADLLLAASINEVESVFVEHKEEIAVLAVDLRNEPGHGRQKLDLVQENLELRQLPLLTICSHNNTAEFTVAMNHDAQIIDVPVDEAAFTRRYNRVCKC